MMRNMLWALFGLTVGYVAGQYDASGSDYTVTRGTEIRSERPIGILVLQAGLGVLNGDGIRLGPLESTGGGRTASVLRGVEISGTTLCVDGLPAPGIRGLARAGWRLLGFLVWDASGRIERTTSLQFRGRNVGIVDRIENGRVWVRVVVGPPLGDPRVRCAVLELSAVENEHDWERLRVRGILGSGTRIQLSCAAQIDLPGDRCRLVSRIARRIAEREAGPELSGRVGGLADAGRAAVLSGRGRLTDSVVAEFLERVCR